MLPKSIDSFPFHYSFTICTKWGLLAILCLYQQRALPLECLLCIVAEEGAVRAGRAQDWCPKVTGKGRHGRD